MGILGKMDWVIVHLRFLGHIPAFWLGLQAVSAYHTVRRYPDLIPIPLASHLRLSLHLPAIVVSHLETVSADV